MWLRLSLTGVAAAAIGVGISATETVTVTSDSMSPTLQRGDRVQVDRALAVRLGPRRGEIWLLRNPRPDDGNGLMLLKRVVAMPGDTVSVAGGRLLLNGKPGAEPYLSGSIAYSSGPTRLGRDAYWVLGDDRNRSEDSHSWGAVPRRHFLGRVFLRHWPLQRFRLL
jgi:signal peptidase I